MQTFQDNTGREWQIELSIYTLGKARELAGVNLAEIYSGDKGELLQRLCEDPVLLCQVVFAIGKPKDSAQPLTNEDFMKAIAGDSLGQAQKALLAELVTFAPGKAARDALANFIELRDSVASHTHEILTKGHELILKKFQGGEFEQELEEVMRKALQKALA